MTKILVVFGTRPEAIKMVPVINALQRHPYKIDVKICVSGQHRKMLDQVMTLFSLEPDYDLNAMRQDQTLSTITCDVLGGIDAVLKAFQPDMMLVHGDTTTTLAASLSAFYNKVRIGHVEAGLRTGNKYAPYPEEVNRKLVGAISDAHFAPTVNARQNLLNEGIDEKTIFVTGNTVIDALLYVSQAIQNDSELNGKYRKRFDFLDASKRLILVTGHRRENFGSGLETICRALRKIAENYSDIELVYPVHLNPNVQAPVRRILEGHKNIHLIEPQEYFPFVYLMMLAWVIITDSGGIQEEAPSLGKPVLVTREITERPEAVDAGTVAIVGTDFDRIVGMVDRLWRKPEVYEQMASSHNPYGDGMAASRIVAHIIEQSNGI